MDGDRLVLVGRHRVDPAAPTTAGPAPEGPAQDRWSGEDVAVERVGPQYGSEDNAVATFVVVRPGPHTIRVSAPDGSARVPFAVIVERDGGEATSAGLPWFAFAYLSFQIGLFGVLALLRNGYRLLLS